MASRDLASNINTATSLTPRLATGTVDGAGVDVGNHRSATALIDMGTFGGTTPTATIEIEESDDDSAYTAVAAADLIGGAIPAIDTTTDNQTLERGYKGAKQYLRVAITAIGGTSPSLPICALIVRSHSRNPPT